MGRVPQRLCPLVWSLKSLWKESPYEESTHETEGDPNEMLLRLEMTEEDARRGFMGEKI